MVSNIEKIPKELFFRRLHSLTGFWLVLFLIEHLLVNSQAALYIGDDGSGFVRAVNGIKNLPYLPVIELFLLGMPIAVHAIWGIKYLWTSQLNSFPTDGSKPALGEYPRNRAFTWQRITSWILLFGIVAHVVQMRFLDYPISQKKGTETYYTVKISNDAGLESLSTRLGFKLFDQAHLKTSDSLIHIDQNAIEKLHIKDNEILAESNNFGTAELLMVRDTFKSPLMMVLYTIFVLSAVFHAFNGLWTFMISWGVTLNVNSQRYMRWFANGLMLIVAFLGLAATWGTYWINLKQ